MCCALGVSSRRADLLGGSSNASFSYPHATTVAPPICEILGQLGQDEPA